MRTAEPEVFIVARPALDYDELARYLAEVGGESWLERLDRGDLDAQNLAEFAGRLCYRSFEPGLNPNVTKIRENQDDYLRNILASAHGSVLEHVSFSFVLHDVSRVLTHELVRHRPGVAISQESLRFVRLDELPFWFPEWAREDDELMRRATAVLEELERFQMWMAGHFGLDEEGVPFSEKKHRTSFMRRFAPRGRGDRPGVDRERAHPAAHHRGPHRGRRGGGDPPVVPAHRRADARGGARPLRRLRRRGRGLDPRLAQGLTPGGIRRGRAARRPRRPGAWRSRGRRAPWSSPRTRTC
ncbi:hypothetical protein GCM10020001_091410 [Nonomuraea salmonea]